MRLPSITTPEAVASLGACLVQGLNGSGKRMVEKIFTTEFSNAGDWSASAACGAACAAPMNDRPRPKRTMRFEHAMTISYVLFCIDRKGQQGVARVDVYAAVHDRRPAVIQRAAAGANAVLGLKRFRRVIVPENFA